MISTKEQLLTILREQGYEFRLFEHPPVFTVDDAMRYCTHVPGAHVKNLFLRNKKKTHYWLLTVKEDKRVDLLALGKQLAGGRLSFASTDDLRALLGIQPGSVTPLAVINDAGRRVKQLFDQDLRNEINMSVHPMENSATVTMKVDALLRFIQNYRPGQVEFIKIPLEGPYSSKTDKDAV